MFQGCHRIYFLVFLFLAWFIVLQVIVEYFDELVSVMERDLGCSMDTIYELCESWLWWRIGAELSGEQKDVEKRNIYEVG